MENEIEIYQIDSFTKNIFHGNPAGVVLNNNLTENQKKLIAREMNLSETAFISDSKIANYKLQWFTPATEVDLCGHATIASLHFLCEVGKISDGQNITFETKSGILKCFVKGGKYFMQIPIGEIIEFEGCKEEIIDVLGIERTDITDLPFILFNNSYLFVAVNSLSALWKIKPDFKLLKKLSETKKEFFDLAVFTTETVEQSSSGHLRFFAPFYGIDEDPVTGSACGPLLLVMLKLGIIKNYKNQMIVFEQGDVLNRKGRVGVQYDSVNNELYISGEAVTVMKGKLFY